MFVSKKKKKKSSGAYSCIQFRHSCHEVPANRPCSRQCRSGLTAWGRTPATSCRRHQRQRTSYGRLIEKIVSRKKKKIFYFSERRSYRVRSRPPSVLLGRQSCFPISVASPSFRTLGDVGTLQTAVSGLYTFWLSYQAQRFRHAMQRLAARRASFSVIFVCHTHGMSTNDSW